MTLREFVERYEADKQQRKEQEMWDRYEQRKAKTVAGLTQSQDLEAQAWIETYNKKIQEQFDRIGRRMEEHRARLAKERDRQLANERLQVLGKYEHMGLTRKYDYEYGNPRVMTWAEFEHLKEETQKQIEESIRQQYHRRTGSAPACVVPETAPPPKPDSLVEEPIVRKICLED